MKILGRMAWSRGNFGDLLTADVLRWAYGDVRVLNCQNGPRILTVGSIAQRALSGDVLAGVGFKTGFATLPHPEETVLWGLRGPLSLEVAAQSGLSTSTVRFLGDPGLLVSRMWPPQSGEVRSGWVVIAHYRHFAYLKRLCSQHHEVRLVSPDQSPWDVAREIRTSEGVISSSLHGIIFAHSYGIPAIALRSPESRESFKYNDYAHCVNWRLEFSSDLEEALSYRSNAVTPDVFPVVREIELPPWKWLGEIGIAGDG